jgi:GT2 family glycosyltransferase/glycosyltransferase involved in cell wall biosynthesis
MSGGQGPTAGTGKLVSVICRTVGRTTLAKALASIAEQTHRDIEIVLVNASCVALDSMLPRAYPFPITLIGGETKLGRADAANAGLDASTGEYLLFLDDDDWIASTHITGLLSTLEANPQVGAAYSSTNKVSANGEPAGIDFDQDFDPILLMRDNFIPIHSVLFRKSLLAHHCRFDTELEVYEDWDFWIQLSQHTRFLHLDSFTAFYREGGDSETDANNIEDRFSMDNTLGISRARVYEKWKNSWSGEQISALIENSLADDAIRSLHVDIAMKNAELDRVAARLEKTASDYKLMQTEYGLIQSNYKLIESAYQTTKQQLEGTQTELAAVSEVAGLRESELRNLRKRMREQQNHIKQLEHAHSLIENSVFWRATYPLRKLRDLLRPATPSQPIASPDAAAEPPETLGHADIDFKAAYSRQAMQHFADFLKKGVPLALPSSESPKKVSIVLVFYNQAHLSLLCLQSIVKHADNVEVIIVDNNSTDETNQLLDLIEGAAIIRNDENRGFVKAVNQAVNLANGEQILLLNNDASLEKDAITIASATLDSADDIGAVGGKILLLDGSLQEAGSLIWRDGSCLGYGRGDDPNKPEYKFRRDVDYCSGAFLLFSKQDFDALAGFDEDFAPAYYEESDFCVRLRKAGKRIVYEPRAVITHFEFASTGGMNKASELQQEHRKLFCEKHEEFLAQLFDNQQHSQLEARSPAGVETVLMIDDRVPYPSMGSGYPRSCHIVHELMARPMRVTFYPLQFPHDDWLDIYTEIGVDVEVMLDHGRERLQQFLEERAGFYDYILISRDHNMTFFNTAAILEPAIAEKTQVIYDAEALIAPREIMQRRLQGEDVSETELNRAVKEEIQKARLADAVIAVSEAEADSFRRIGNKQTVVAGHAISARRGDKGFEARRDMLFVGALREDESPNVDSLLWFIENSLPAIVASEPDAKLIVVGENTAPALESIKQDHVVFMGRQASIEEFYDNCRVFIAPTRFAAGIPHKVHEAAANGIPSVVTPLLAGQLNWRDETELLVAESGDEFARQCLRLYQDGSLWQAVQDGGSAAVARDCSEQGFRDSLYTLFDKQAS